MKRVIKSVFKLIKTGLLYAAMALLVFFVLDQWRTRHMLDSGMVIPQLHFQSLDGGIEHLAPNGRPWLLYFFAPWCQVCHLSIGQTEKLAERGINIKLIALDYQQRSELAAFATKHQLSSSILLGGARDKAYFNVKAYPSFYLLDADLQVQAKGVGFRPAFLLQPSPLKP